MRQRLSNTDATRVFADTLQKPEGKGERGKSGCELKQTEMFIRHLSGNDCVDLLFEKCVTREVEMPDRSNRARLRSYLSMCIPATDIREHFEIDLRRSEGLSPQQMQGMVLALLRRQ
jgi:hypothetical protein